MLTAQKYVDLHQEFLTEFDDIQSTQRDERLQCLQDRRFYSIPGAQWEGSLGEQYENKPKFEVNKVHLAVIRIINEYRNNRITVNFVPKNGTENDQLADAANGLYRADEQDSQADEAYDNAFEEAVGGGYGAWRLCAIYEDDEDDENEYQTIRMEPIYDADSNVWFDLNAKRQDKADASRCFVLTPMSPKAYKKEYGDDAPASVNKQVHQFEFDWFAPDLVYIAEVYDIEKVPEKVIVYEGIDGAEKRYRLSELEDDPSIVQTLVATGFKKVRTKSIKVQKCHKYIMSGNGILEDCGYIAGRWIPVVPCYGKRWFVDNVERCMGHVRLSKDAQRLKNMQTSKLGELAAFSSVEKPIFTPEQIAGHGPMWEDDNIKNYPYLLINPITDANGNESVQPVAYTKVPQIPPALAALLQITDQDIKELLGAQEAGEEIQPNLSGVAIELIQNRLDMQSFIYLSNFAKAVKRSGEIWQSMAKDLLVEEGRKKKAIGDKDEIKSLELRRPVQDPKTSEVKYENDLTSLNHDVYVEVGPSSASKRASTVRALTGMITITDDPETKQVLSAMVMMNMEGEGVSDTREFFRQKLVRMGVVKPTDDEKAMLEAERANQQPSPQDTYLLAAAEQAEGDAAKARADTVLKSAQAGKAEAEAVKTLSEIDREDRKQLVDEIKAATELQQQTGNQPPVS